MTVVAPQRPLTRRTAARVAWRRAALVVALAAIAAVILALGAGTSFVDALVLTIASMLGAPLAAMAGWWALGRVGSRTFATQALVVAVVAVLATAVGVGVAANAMFISHHDLMAVLVVLVASSGAGAGAALQLGARLTQESAALADLAGRIGDDAHLDGGGGSEPDRRADPPAASELASLRERLRQVSAELTASRERERELVTWVSHDLRSPLAGIRAMAEAVEDGVVTDRGTVVRYAGAIGVESQRLARLVDDLFELSRIQHGTPRPDGERAALGDVVSDVVAGLAPAARAKRVDVVADLSSLPAAAVVPMELGRVFQNLLDNAVRHTAPGGRVRLAGALTADGTVEIAIEDGCGGIPEADLARVFDVAFRGDAARRRDAGGGGLGLAIARGLLEAHGGTVSAANTAHGCRFTVALPSRL